MFQVSDPVAAEFSLNTQMYLLSKKSLWLSDGSMGFGQESDIAFAEGTVLQMGRLLCLPAITPAGLCSLGVTLRGEMTTSYMVFSLSLGL